MPVVKNENTLENVFISWPFKAGLVFKRMLQSNENRDVHSQMDLSIGALRLLFCYQLNPVEDISPTTEYKNSRKCARQIVNDDRINRIQQSTQSK